MLIIPAIDLIDGRTVRLTQGDYARETDYGLDPVAVAKSFEADGAEWLHVVDLDGAKAGHPVNLPVLQRIAFETSLKIEFGGGLRDFVSIDAALAMGAERVVLGSRLAQDFAFAEELFRRFGDQVVGGIDARDGMVAVEGWTETGTVSGTDLAVKLVGLGCRRIITTDIARDGSLVGPNLDWLVTMLAAVDVPVIASGGVSALSDLNLLRGLPAPGVEAVIVGKALYEGRFRLAEAIALA